MKFYKFSLGTFLRTMILLVLLLICCGIYYRQRVIGILLERPLEVVLTDLFGMPVRMEGLQVDFISGDIFASRLTFRNQKKFPPNHHLDAVNLRGRLNFKAIKEKQVLISYLDFDKVHYQIDRIADAGHKTTNVQTWWRHIKYERKKDDRPKPPSKPDGKRWLVRIDTVQIRNGSFIFDDQSGDMNNRFVFRELNGYMTGFQWPTDIEKMPQEVVMKGLLGDKYPAPFELKGKANFPTSRISFDFDAKIVEGELQEYQRFWDGLPLQMQQGKFHLNLKLICQQRKMRSENELTLKELKISPPPSVTGVIWGLPLIASINFLQSEKEIHLRVPVEGDVADINFDFPKAFRAAFQEALRGHTSNGLKLLAAGPAKLVEGTQQVAMKAPQKIAEGIEKISEIVKPKEK